jgi:hypothetical protein
VGQDVAGQRAAGDEGIGETGKQILDQSLPVRQEAVKMPIVRHPAPVLGAGGQFIALNDGHLGVLPGQHVGGEQAGDAAAEDDRAISGVRRHRCHLVRLTRYGGSGCLGTY